MFGPEVPSFVWDLISVKHGGLIQEGQDHANTTLSSVFIISGAVQQLRQYNVASVLRTMVRVLVWKYHNNYP